MREIGVVYLYRFAEGEAPVRHFLETLQRHPAGLPYDLHVIFKGFPNEEARGRGKALFASMHLNSVPLEDAAYDIGSYVQAARAVNNPRLLFLNTFSVILGDGWLSHFSHALDRPQVGIVGATGSWQARTTGYEVQARLLAERIARVPSRVLGRTEPTRPVVAPRRPKTPREVVRFALAPATYFYHLLRYPRYPNPHIRTNAFMVRRGLFLSLQFPRFDSKEDAYGFESGRRSMTRQIMSKALRPVVVGRDGSVYEVEQWQASSTFWKDQQRNLLIADNRTRDYAEGTNEFRTKLENSAWRHPRSWLNA